MAAEKQSGCGCGCLPLGKSVSKKTPPEDKKPDAE